MMRRCAEDEVPLDAALRFSPRARCKGALLRSTRYRMAAVRDSLVRPMSITATDLRVRSDRLPAADRTRFRKRLAGAEKIADPVRHRKVLATIAAALDATERRIAARRQLAPETIEYPEDLPITGRRSELLATIAGNPVVIVAGETGSGKSTQLPKLCLELGRGVDGLIGHTQPRRIAARSIAGRVAEELGTSIGDLVGYTVRFSDQVGDRTLVKVMTDGILLAETHRDRMLRRYDTLILDEAHERSLNIDFLLGYLKRLLPKRPDLKLIVTSATIDTERFAAHFEDAPVIEVSGRTHPVEIRYRPLDDRAADEPRDQPQGICDAVAELVPEGGGDILVFCSGEREIRDAVDALTEMGLRHTEILPLYGRLPAAEQQRIFSSHTGRRIVVSTNVAETSLTVPGVRFVVDAGTARISRYSRRTKVQQLPIEAISRASASQRAGRCGRLGPGICVRLYSEDDLASRPEYTEPEIQRTNLASVILQMAALGLGDIESFPFLDPPDARSVKDGIALLHELGAVDPEWEGRRRWLTDIGRRLVHFPVDLRLGRMLLQAAEDGCLGEMLVIAAALSIQDVRERPQDREQQADQMHARFRDAESDFLTLLNLWRHIRTQRKDRSSSAFRRMCRDEYLNYKRVREWQDIHGQLRDVAREQGLIVNRRPATPDVIHRAALAGLLSHVGVKDPDGYDYRGARGARFWIAPGSSLFKAAPDWVMAAELTETSRLWARTVVRIPAEWVEDVGAHLIRRSLSDPWWDAERGSAVARETTTMLGIPLATDRVVQYGRFDPAGARELFIRHALVAGEWDTHHEFVARNDARIDEVLELEARERRRDLLISDEALFDVFDARIPDDVASVAAFDRWWRDVRHDDPHRLDLAVRDLIDPAAAELDPAAFPETWRHGDVAMTLDYEFEPGSVHDGITVDVPVGSLDRLDPAVFDWNVPGLRDELLTALVRSLPKEYRRRLVPIPETVARLRARLKPETGVHLLPAVRRELAELGAGDIPADALTFDGLPPHLRPRFRIVTDGGDVLAEGGDLAALKTTVTDAARASLSDAGHELERDGATEWDFGDLPSSVTIGDAGHAVTAYPALVDEGGSVAVRLLATEGEQMAAMWGGVVRLLRLGLPGGTRLLRPLLTEEVRFVLERSAYPDWIAWAEDCVAAALGGVVADAGGPVWDRASYERLLASAREQLADRLDDVAWTSLEILDGVRVVVAMLEEMPDARYDDAVADIELQLGRLVYPGFLGAIRAARVPDVRRYVAAIERRVERLPEQVDRDRELMDRINAVEAEYERVAGLLPPSDRLVDVAWQLEELRVSLFAQHLGTSGKVSERRILESLDDIEMGR
jgi:ATP-dependent helicase HrpA